MRFDGSSDILVTTALAEATASKIKNDVRKKRTKPSHW